MCSVYNSSKVRWPRQSQRSEFSRGAWKHVAIAVAGLNFTAAWILSFILWRLQSAVCKMPSRAPWCVLSFTCMVQNTPPKKKKSNQQVKSDFKTFLWEGKSQVLHWYINPALNSNLCIYKYYTNIIIFIIISYNNNYTLKKYSYSPTSNDY